MRKRPPAYGTSLLDVGKDLIVVGFFGRPEVAGANQTALHWTPPSGWGGGGVPITQQRCLPEDRMLKHHTLSVCGPV